MPDRSTATRASVLAAVSVLSGSAVTGVSYYGFSYGGENWDHGDHHCATMGVELATEDARQFVACWGDAFGHFGLELVEGNAPELFRNHPDRRDFSAHEWWAPLQRAGGSAELVWRSDHVEEGRPAPVALALRNAEHYVSIANAAPVENSPMSRGGFLLGMDEVLVTGDLTFAQSIGLAPTGNLS